MKILAPISVGELYDKISTLEIKSEKITDVVKLGHINSELAFLKGIFTRQKMDHSLFFDLKEVNKKLWQIEDEIRVYEREKDFGENFIDLARSVYHYNDKRFSIKNEINKKYNSTIFEEKSYEQY